jgi:hypothetical protein
MTLVPVSRMYRRVKVALEGGAEFWPAQARFTMERPVSPTGTAAGIPIGIRLHCWIDAMDANRLTAAAQLELFANITRAGRPLHVGVFFYGSNETEEAVNVEFRALLSRWEYTTAQDLEAVGGDADGRGLENMTLQRTGATNLMLRIEFTGLVDPDGLQSLGLYLSYGAG